MNADPRGLDAAAPPRTRLVIADDHDLVRAGLVQLLGSMAGVDVVGEARNGMELLDAVEALRPDVVITDITMPGTDGLEAVEQLRARGHTVKILIVSMYDTLDFVHRALRAGANGYLLKGSPASEIEFAIRRVVEGGNYYSAEVSQRLAQPQEAKPTELLTGRQLEVLVRLAQGQSSKEIAFELQLSSKTVDVHRAAIMSRLGLRDLASLILYAVRMGLVDPQTQPGPMTR